MELGNGIPTTIQSVIKNQNRMGEYQSKIAVLDAVKPKTCTVDAVKPKH
jgi:hypothetical protein